jgi:hypothetical protein
MTATRRAGQREERCGLPNGVRLLGVSGRTYLVTVQSLNSALDITSRRPGLPAAATLCYTLGCGTPTCRPINSNSPTATSLAL